MNTLHLKTMGLLTIVLLILPFHSFAQTFTIKSDTSDYRILYRTFYPIENQSPQTGAFADTDGTYSVSIAGFSSVVENEYYRVILEFDISELTAPVDQATFNVYLNNSTGDDFPVDLWGSSINRDEFVLASDPTATDEFFSGTYSYSKLGLSPDPFIESTDPVGQFYTIDITNFINDRISDYQSSPTDSIVLIKLRPEGAYSGSTLETNYEFANSDAASTLQPHLEITPGDITQTVSGNEGWQMLSSPVPGTSFGTLTNDVWTQGFTGADNSNGTANIYTWNEGNGTQDTTARGFTPISDASQTPSNGKGFLVYVYEDDDPTTSVVDGGFPKNIGVSGFAPTGTVTPSVSLTKQGGTYVSNRDGWNLVGNPFGGVLDWDDNTNWTKTNIDNTIYVWDSSANGGNGAYLTWNGSSGSLSNGEIGAWQGFWVKANNNGVPELEVTDGAIIDPGSGTLYKDTSPVSQIELKLSTENNLTSSAYLSFNPESSLQKDAYDAYKIQSLNKKSNYLYFSGNNQAALEIQSIPKQIDEMISFPLRYHNNTSEPAMTLDWNAQNIPPEVDVLLTDHVTGQRYNLRTSGSIAIQSENQKRAPGQISSTTTQKDKIPINPYPKVVQAKTSDARFTITVVPNARAAKKKPTEVSLKQNYPNPFNPETVIRYSVPSQSQVTLQVYDMLGRRVRTLVNSPKSAGRYEANFDASNLASGLYIYQLKVGTNILTKKMTLIK